ncbi:MAG: prephenate dehydrogenase/arogenate dehydrogenase family protein [Sulfuricella sp.]|nr:prephenate dehydrogenase/arogenate dehydrogenase family protein [Sulfuricella sp.]
MALINKLAIFGVGLIGGSLALALREAGAVNEVVGVGRSVENLNAALEMRVIDRVAANAADAVQGADLVLLAMPVGQMGAVMANIAPHLQAGTVVTDAGSTKQDVVALARRHLPKHLEWFVPAHPIAGAEHSGVKAARADLYRGRNVVLTPLPENTPAALETVDAAWRACGAKLARTTAANHDSVFAAVSHLPHLLAFALVDDIAAKPNAGELFHHAASGFRDFTRIAASSPEMWRDICLANRDALLHELDAYQAQLTRLHEMLEKGDGGALEQVFDRASQARRKWAMDKGL